MGMVKTSSSKRLKHLKSLLCSKPILVFRQKTERSLLKPDSSGYATGAVLSQCVKTTKWASLCIHQQKSIPAEWNMTSMTKDVAIMRALEQWRHYSREPNIRSRFSWIIKTLSTFYEPPKKLNRQQARWSLYLSHFDINLTALSG